MTDNLESKFHNEMLALYETAKVACNYSATRFRQMVLERGGLATAKALLSSTQFSDGLTTLYLCGRLDLCVESVVLRDPWRSLFSEEEIAIARRRLQELDYDPPGD
jgi:5-methylcytosine-specific restriction enzyme A